MRERREGLSWIMLVTLLLACMTIQSARAPEKPKMFVDPRVSTAAPTNNFTINISVSNVTGRGVYSWYFRMYFNTTVLDAVNVTEGPFLSDTGYYTDFRQDINNTAGIIDVLCYIDEFPFPDWGANGSGVLCNIAFQVQANGKTLLNLEDTELHTVVGESESPIDHTVSDGFFEYPLKNHDIAVTNVTPSPTSVLFGENVSISVTVENQGNVTETFDITTYFNITATYNNVTVYNATEWHACIDTIRVTNLANGSSTTLNLTWDTRNTFAATGGNFTRANCTVKAEATLVGVLDFDPDDNTLISDATVTITAAAHDVVVISVVPAQSWAYPTWTVPLEITVTVLNNGTNIESLSVTAYYSESSWHEIDTKYVVGLATCNTKILTFSWTVGGAVGNHTIKANVTLLEFPDSNSGNNEKNATVSVMWPGDVTHSGGYVDLGDLLAFLDTWSKKPGDTGYDPRADFDGTGGYIDLGDLLIFLDYWSTKPP